MQESITPTRCRPAPPNISLRASTFLDPPSPLLSSGVSPDDAQVERLFGIRCTAPNQLELHQDSFENFSCFSGTFSSFSEIKRWPVQAYSSSASRWPSWASLAPLHPQSWWNGKLHPTQETTSSQLRRCMRGCGRPAYHRALVKFSVKCMIPSSSCQVMLCCIPCFHESFCKTNN